VSDKPAHVRDLPRLTSTDISTITTRYRERLKSLQAIDEAIKAVVDKTVQTGVHQQTIFIFTSDNGWLQGQHRFKKGKSEAYNESACMPLSVWGYGISPGRVSFDLVDGVDIPATIADMSGAIPGLMLDGQSLWGYLQGISAITRQDMLIEHYGDEIVYKGVRRRDYVYVSYPMSEELYDLSADPYQLVSRHGDPAYASIKSQLMQRLGILQTCIGSQCW